MGEEQECEETTERETVGEPIDTMKAVLEPLLEAVIPTPKEEKEEI
jgi:hypothetical protein